MLALLAGFRDHPPARMDAISDALAVAGVGIVIAAGIGGGYFFNVIVAGGAAGPYLASFTALATLPDLYVSMFKAILFGWLAAIVGAYKGLNAGGGPSGVGQAVNESVIVAFMMLFGKVLEDVTAARAEHAPPVPVSPSAEVVSFRVVEEASRILFGGSLDGVSRLSFRRSTATCRRWYCARAVPRTPGLAPMMASGLSSSGMFGGRELGLQPLQFHQLHRGFGQHFRFFILRRGVGQVGHQRPQ